MLPSLFINHQLTCVGAPRAAWCVCLSPNVLASPILSLKDSGRGHKALDCPDAVWRPHYVCDPPL